MHLNIEVHNENLLISTNSIFFTWKFDIIDNYFDIYDTIHIKFLSNHIMALYELVYGLGSCNKETEKYSDLRLKLYLFLVED